jgi:penicillin V acylase-like amidase (Ntn superfamily)
VYYGTDFVSGREVFLITSTCWNDPTVPGGVERTFPVFRRVFVAVLVVLSGLTGPAAEACTTLCLRSDGRIVFGKNYDWTFDDGLLIVNKRGVVRTSDHRPAADAARWASRYGSVTFNQYGRDFPSGGMNETGLVVELMWADGSKYPPPDARPALDCLEWIQYQLDRANSIAEVIASDAKIRIESDVPLHYLVADRKGQIAVIEFIGGKLVAHTGADLPLPVLANDLYSDALRFVEKTKWRPPDFGSHARFARAADRVRTFRPESDPVAYVFDTLRDVGHVQTQWSIVYEIDRGRVHFCTRGNRKTRTLTLTDLDFSCASPVQALDLKNDAGDVRASLRPYSRDLNLRLIRSSYAQTEFLAKVPSAELERIAARPESSTCQARPAAPS